MSIAEFTEKYSKNIPIVVLIIIFITSFIAGILYSKAGLKKKEVANSLNPQTNVLKTNEEINLSDALNIDKSMPFGAKTLNSIRVKKIQLSKIQLNDKTLNKAELNVTFTQAGAEKELILPLINKLYFAEALKDQNNKVYYPDKELIDVTELPLKENDLITLSLIYTINENYVTKENIEKYCTDKDIIECIMFQFNFGFGENPIDIDNYLTELMNSQIVADYQKVVAVRISKPYQTN
ncbi:hypothetical protein A2774_01860 [Candidatus Roizmanbacteria bacterium RIFCSPHIGHO2_01_FULL_39_12c]|uniref:Uncharacterized protein n=1 Tax=Candidatus Roizmanbacteria bacterium RIFCSPHIGHO2_01_FULL_39_12c TaxID=1802031 RepID=A0A1F7GB45_9BACT|nr:MAG: hypothetical protein A2774_01860 [Candidatus Roizmanbacteria bacterium RIFCSPHIGHO2_01_FULL_39_12c]OGK46938.1 MAG: hypothetical protein A2963_05270 [Candidatus Roizmanbacteria bacterium RIFCSPLOWO2_01_FULL_40_13]